MKRFLPALLLATIVTLTAPFMGLIRNYLFDTFAKKAVAGLTFALAAVALVLLTLAVARIREHRLLRYAGLAVVGGLLWIQAIGFRTQLADVNVVEKVHIVEYGLLAFLLYRAFGPRKDLAVLLLVLLWTSFAGTVEEGMQWWVETRTGEIRDVFLNAFSGLCGLVFSLSVDPPKAFSWTIPAHRRRSLGTSAAAVVLAMGAFFYHAHLGYLIEDPEIGRFRSYFTRDQLVEAARRRAELWAHDPPRGLSPWRKEDLFLTEAGWHCQHRNDSLRLGFPYRARQANRILEKYYAPYLDLESFLQAGDRRLSPDTARQLDAQAPRHPPERYLSPVGDGRIYTWPSKPLFVMLVLVVALALWGLPRVLNPRGSPDRCVPPPSVPDGT